MTATATPTAAPIEAPQALDFSRSAVAAAVEKFLGSVYTINDYLSLRLPLRYNPDFCTGGADWYDPERGVNAEPDRVFSVDLSKMAEVCPELLIASGDISSDDDEALYCPWQSLPVGMGSIGFKFYPKGLPQQGWGPFAEIAFCPGNVAYGFNGVSDCRTIESGLKIGLAAIIHAHPHIPELFSVDAGVLMRVDSTGSQNCGSPAQVQAMLDRLGDVQVGHIRASGTAPDDLAVLNFRTVKYFNASSESWQAVAYDKRAETQKKLAELRRHIRQNPGDAVAKVRLERMESPEYTAFVSGNLRLEARMLKRGLTDHLARLGHKWDGSITEIIRIERALSESGIHLLHSAWAHCWRAQITALWGDPNMTLRDTDDLFARLRAHFAEIYADRPKAARSSYRRCQTLINACMERGYQKVRREILDSEAAVSADIESGAAAESTVPAGIMSSSSWYRTISELKGAGVSLATLEALDGTASSRVAAGVAVSMVSRVTCTAVTALPEWFARVVGDDYGRDPFEAPRAIQAAPRTLSIVPSAFPAAVDHDASAIDESCEEFLHGIDERAQEPDEPSFFDLAVARAAAGKKYTGLKRAHLAAVDRPKAPAGQRQTDMFTV